MNNTLIKTVSFEGNSLKLYRSNNPLVERYFTTLNDLLYSDEWNGLTIAEAKMKDWPTIKATILKGYDPKLHMKLNIRRRKQGKQPLTPFQSPFVEQFNELYGPNGSRSTLN